MSGWGFTGDYVQDYFSVEVTLSFKTTDIHTFHAYQKHLEKLHYELDGCCPAVVLCKAWSQCQKQ